MRHPRSLPRCLPAAFALLASLSAQEVKRTFAVRVDGRVVGYQIETETVVKQDDREVVRYQSKGIVKVELLGAGVDQRVDQTWILEPKTRAALRLESRLEAGATKIEAHGELVGATFELGDGKKLDPAKVVIAPDFRWLRDRGPKQAGESVELDCLMPEVGGVMRCTIACTADPERQIEVLGTRTAVRVYDVAVAAIGMELVVFVRSDTFEAVRYELPAQKMVIEMAAPAVVERLERFDMTSTILVRTNLDIGDPSVLTAMRLRATIDTSKHTTAGSLNVPGQRFEGTVEGGRIEGVFEIRPLRSDGVGAPAFPVPEGAFAEPELQPFLQPAESIESDDPGLTRQARELATGATTCFQVVDRLARWTHASITYEIPGGSTAKRTFELRRGECGGHSRLLAAMLRSLGIPARTPMGGMYVPLYGGSFGQHMWTEVWLGATIGWLAVDCTAGESTFIDAGHIRLADGVSSFRPHAIEVLDSEPKPAPASAPAARRTDAYPYRAGETLTYAWSVGGKSLGEERVTYEGRGEAGHVFGSVLELSGGKLVETTKTTAGDDGRLVAFHAERKAGGETTVFDVQAADGKATSIRKSGDDERKNVSDVEPSVFVLHNNCTAHFAIAACRAAPLVEGAEAVVRLFHVEQRSVFQMTIRRKAPADITVGGVARQARVFEVELVGLAITLHLDDAGRVLRYHQKQGDVVIELR